MKGMRTTIRQKSTQNKFKMAIFWPITTSQTTAQTIGGNRGSCGVGGSGRYHQDWLTFSLQRKLLLLVKKSQIINSTFWSSLRNEVFHFFLGNVWGSWAISGAGWDLGRNLSRKKSNYQFDFLSHSGYRGFSIFPWGRLRKLRGIRTRLGPRTKLIP